MNAIQEGLMLVNLEKADKRECICDFAGNHKDPHFWADLYWFGEESIVVLGGSWPNYSEFFRDRTRWITTSKEKEAEIAFDGTTADVIKFLMSTPHGGDA